MSDLKGLKDKRFFLNTDSLPGIGIDELQRHFKLLDLDQNGYVGAGELRHLLTVLGERPTDEEIDEMIAEVDDKQQFWQYEM